MRISRKFRQLTRKTYPLGYESQLLRYLPRDIQMDEYGNYFINIGDSNTMFSCHLDTASGTQTKVNHIIDGDMIMTDGASILGADDKAGMIVLLYMIENEIPGLYYFFIGEESGCVGSGDLSEGWWRTEFSYRINKMISFDRCGYDSIITEQMCQKSCSDEFALELASRLNMVEDSFKYTTDPTGIYTDSAEFIDLIPECTNISVGYFNEHSGYEEQNIEFLRKLCKSVVKIDWDSLPIVRNLLY